MNDPNIPLERRKNSLEKGKLYKYIDKRANFLYSTMLGSNPKVIAHVLPDSIVMFGYRSEDYEQTWREDMPLKYAALYVGYQDVFGYLYCKFSTNQVFEVPEYFRKIYFPRSRMQSK